VELALVGGGYTGRREGGGDSKMAHRAIGTLLTLQKNHGEVFFQCTVTNARKFFRIKIMFQYINSYMFRV